MKSPLSSTPVPARKLCPPLAVALLSLAAHAATGATIEGRAINADGAVLYKVPVCLARTSAPVQCEKTRWTDKRGSYSFAGLQPGNDYVVTVNGDVSASTRKLEVYANYVWEHSRQAAALHSKNDRAVLKDFVGKFNFSNYQRVLILTANDFPELASIDLEGSYVALKVFIPSSQADVPPETIFLGRVQNADKLAIEASVPLPARELGYEIFSATLSLGGSIGLAGN